MWRDTEAPLLDARRRQGTASAIVAILGLAVMLVALAGRDSEAQVEFGEPLKPRPEVETPEELYKRDCAWCHGEEADGTAFGPSLVDAGTAGIDFMVSTGRMPIRDTSIPLRRRLPKYTEEEIAELVDYLSQFTVGPPVPEVEVKPHLLAEGGKLFRQFCVYCHQYIGTGGPLTGGSREAATLHWATATQVVEAIRFGPGTMPVFSEEEITEEEADAIATYIALEVQHPTDRGGIALGHFGPFSEGFVTWVALLWLLVGCWWIGKRT